MLTFSQLPNKTQPKKIHQWRDLSERKPIHQSGGFIGTVRSGAIGAVRVGSSSIWCEWVRERWRDNLARGATISLLSLLSLSISLFTRGSEMARRSRWSVTRFDKGGFEQSEWCDRLAPMQSDCILAPTRRPSCSLSLSLSLSLSSIFQGRNHLKWKWKRKSFSTVLAIFYGQPGNAFQFDPIWSNNQTPTFLENHFRNQFEAKTKEPQNLNMV